MQMVSVLCNMDPAMFSRDWRLSLPRSMPRSTPRYLYVSSQCSAGISSVKLTLGEKVSTTLQPRLLTILSVAHRLRVRLAQVKWWSCTASTMSCIPDVERLIRQRSSA